MAIFVRKYFTEVFRCQSDKPLPYFKEELSQFFNDQRVFKGVRSYHEVNLTGRWLSDTEFEMTRKWEWGSTTTPKYGKTMMYLYGQVLANENKTEIIFSVTNPSAPFSIIGPVLIGLVAILDADNMFVAWLVGLACIFVIPPLFLLQGYNSKTRLKDSFINQFNLTIPEA